MIATCIAGELRTFNRSDVRENILASLRGVKEDMDTFVTVRTDIIIHRVKALFVQFKPVAVVLRSANDTLGALRSHTLCWSLIVMHESIRGSAYQIVMRMRTDIVYNNLEETLVRFIALRNNTDDIYVEACGARKKTVPKTHVYCSKFIQGNSRHSSVRMGCVKDTWAMMGRRAAATYFDPLTFFNYNKTLCFDESMECSLGCAVYQKNSLLRFTPVDLKRQIIRANSILET